MRAVYPVIRCWADSWFDEYGEPRYDLEDDGSFIGYGGKPRSSCLLDYGHEGPHEWTPDSEITVTFR